MSYITENSACRNSETASLTKMNIGSFSAISLRAVREESFSVVRASSLEEAAPVLLDRVGERTVLAVIDSGYNDILGGALAEKVAEIFKNNDFSYILISPGKDGKEDKGTENLYKIIDAALAAKMPRNGVIVAVGGGVVTDLVGFAAQTYRRMIEYIRVPTTLVGQIDAGIGVKVGINYNENKNLLGSFYAPSLVVNCSAFLHDLDDDNFACGISEILKAGIADCAEILDMLYNEGACFSGRLLKSDAEAEKRFDKIMELSICTMLGNLSENLYEQKDLKRNMDFGHTFGPIYEGATDYKIPHAYAVAIDMFICAHMSRALGLLENGDFEIYEKLFEQYELLKYYSLVKEQMLPLFHSSVDKTVLHRAGDLNLVMPHGYGRSSFLNLTECKTQDTALYSVILSRAELFELYKNAVRYIEEEYNGATEL